MRYKPWVPGDPCKRCGKPLLTLADKFQPHNSICKPCGNARLAIKRDAMRQKAALPCTQCQAQMLTWTERRRGTCKACRADKRCACGSVLLQSDMRYANCAACRKTVRLERKEIRWCGCGSQIEQRRRYAKMCAKCATKARTEAGRKGAATMRTQLRNSRPMATEARPADTPGAYAPPMTRAQALAADVGGYDPARVAWIDAVCARRRVGVRG